MCIINNPLCYEGILSRRSAFRITVLSKLLSVIRGQGSRGTLRFRLTMSFCNQRAGLRRDAEISTDAFP